MALSHKQLAGPGYIILNVIRAMNIIALLSVIAGCVVMLVKTFIVSKFFFFDAVSNVITACVSTFLIVSECSIFKPFFARNWPLLSVESGFVSLGISMMVIGVNMLGNLNKEATTQKSLGLAFWRLVIASGILVFVLGFFNIVASFVFCDRKRGITARNVRAHGAIAEPTPSIPQKPLSINTSLPPPVTAVSPSLYSSGGTTYNNPYTQPTGRRETLLSPRRMFSPLRDGFRRARDSVLPSYYQSRSPFESGSPKRETREKRESVGPRMKVNVSNISAPMNVNPQFAHLVKPDLAHHPSRNGKDSDMGIAF